MSASTGPVRGSFLRRYRSNAAQSSAMALLTGTPPDHAMSDQGRHRRRTWTRSIWAALGLLPFVAIIVLVGVGLAAIVAQGGAPDWLAKLSYVGQAFGVLTSVFR